MTDEGRARSAEAWRRRRLAGTGRIEHDIVAVAADGPGAVDFVVEQLDERAGEGWRLVGPVQLGDGTFVATMTREILP